MKVCDARSMSGAEIESDHFERGPKLDRKLIKVRRLRKVK